jgi:hypothetical protein
VSDLRAELGARGASYLLRRLTAIAVLSLTVGIAGLTASASGDYPYRGVPYGALTLTASGKTVFFTMKFPIAVDHFWIQFGASSYAQLPIPKFPGAYYPNIAVSGFTAYPDCGDAFVAQGARRAIQCALNSNQNVSGTEPKIPAHTLITGRIVFSRLVADDHAYVLAGSRPAAIASHWDAQTRIVHLTKGVKISGRVSVGCGCSLQDDPIAKATVRIHGPESVTTSTATDGTYSAVVKRGNYTVAADVPGFAFQPAKRTLTAHHDRSAVNFHGCAQPHGIARVAALDAAAASATWDLWAHGFEFGRCMDIAAVHYTPSSNTLRVTWLAPALICEPGHFVYPETPPGVYVIKKHTLVGANPGDQVQQTGTVARPGLSALVHDPTGLLEMQVTLPPAGAGKKGTISLVGSPEFTRFADGEHICRAETGQLDLTPQPPA